VNQMTQVSCQCALSLLLWQDINGAFRRIWEYLKYPVEIGSLKISLVSLVTGILVLVLAIFLSRTISSMLERRIAKRTYIDPGLRYTISRLAGYLIITLGVLTAVTQALGINLTSIAVLFTALSVGIGFGLQYIAADIASGFILLFERPVRVGDHISIGDDEGDVHSIKLRTTIVYTNDGIAVIVPNSRLVTQRVINWSYGEPHARISIPVSVASESDIDLVTETLLLVAQGVDRVLTDPPPNVQFLKFGDYSYDFRLLVWTHEPSRHLQIRSEINYRIAKLFRESGIELSRPVQEFRMQSSPDLSLKDLPLAHDPGSMNRQDG
jgi:potassium-dependent mechanosensitive channel